MLVLRQVDANLGLTHLLPPVPTTLGQAVPATAGEKKDPLGEDRFNPQHRGLALAGPSTLNRLELSNNRDRRCPKRPHDPAKIEACLLHVGVQCLPKPAAESVIDLEAMGHLVHDEQEGRYFSGCYGDYCYLPLYGFVGNIPWWAQLRTSCAGAGKDGGGHPAALPPGADHRAGGQRLLPGGDHGLVRVGRGVLLSGSGQELRAGRATGAGAGRRAGPPLSDRGQRAGVCRVWL
jgi:hypothetical protein